MQAAIYPGKGKSLTIKSLADPAPGPNDVVISVNCCAIAEADLAMTKGETWDYPAGPIGREYAGTVVAVGREVANRRIGDFVVAMPFAGCGHCNGCALGNNLLCRSPVTAMSGFAEFAQLSASSTYLLPQSIPPVQVTLTEPLAICRYGMEKTRLRSGDRVLVVGGGTTALLTGWLARHLGAKVVHLSSSPAIEALRQEQMPAACFPNFVARRHVFDALDGAPDVIFECSGQPGAMAKAAEYAGEICRVVSLTIDSSSQHILPARKLSDAYSFTFYFGYSDRNFEYALGMLANYAHELANVKIDLINLADCAGAINRLKLPGSPIRTLVSPR